ncbi:MAG TPA: protein kinase [Thermoanaerobaculia bacterium]|nr:protein kinase [Thermoanaerobaculia bacterium]
MAFTCIRCHQEIDREFKACPHCGEAVTDFLRRYMEEPVDGKYRLLERLGAGGMGEVYKVVHTFLGVVRVIKVIRPQISESRDAHERFLREAQLATKVHHPNVATLHDFSALPDGSHYMVWEFIEGENIAQRIHRGGVLPARYAIRLAVESLEGLEAIHRAGIVHRDISPENLMISRQSDGTEHVKIIDLGVAKSTASTDSGTRTGIFLGKLRYASPEHLGFLTEGESIDGRADLYSLGIVLYETLTGRPPFEATSPHQYLLLHSGDTKMLQPIDLSKTLPGGTALQGVVEKALERVRNRRFANAREFIDALNAVLKTLPDPSSQMTMMTPFDADATIRQGGSVMPEMPVTEIRPVTGSPAASGPLPTDTLHRPTVVSNFGSLERAAAPTLHTPAPAPLPPLPTLAQTEPMTTPVPPQAPAPPVAATPPVAAAPPAAAPAHPTVITQSGAKPARGGMIVVAVILFVGLAVIGAGSAGAWWWWTHIRQQPAVKMAQTQTAPATYAPSTAQVEVTSPPRVAETATTATTTSTSPPAPASTSTVFSTPIITTSTERPQDVPPVPKIKPKKEPKPEPAPTDEQAQEPAPAEEESPASDSGPQYLEGRRGSANDEAMASLQRQVHGVTRVRVHGTGDYDLTKKFIDLLQNNLGLQVTERADVTIEFRGTLGRGGFGKKRRYAHAAVIKNGRTIFRYDLPYEEYRVGDDPAEALARVLSDGFR